MNVWINVRMLVGQTVLAARDTGGGGGQIGRAVLDGSLGDYRPAQRTVQRGRRSLVAPNNYVRAPALSAKRKRAAVAWRTGLGSYLLWERAAAMSKILPPNPPYLYVVLHLIIYVYLEKTSRSCTSSSSLLQLKARKGENRTGRESRRTCRACALGFVYCRKPG